MTSTYPAFGEPAVHRPKKSLGQHFLASSRYAERIATAIPAISSAHIVEIGPGRGALSVHLLKRFPQLHMVEFDAEILPVLREVLGNGEYTIHNADARTFPFSQLGEKLHLAGNLPYNVGTGILESLVALGSRIDSMTFMLQREVALRITATAGVRPRCPLSVVCQTWGKPKILFHVPPGAFYPPPKVVSSVIQILRHNIPENQINPERFPAYAAFVEQLFRQRRKQVAPLLNTLYPGVPWGARCAEAGIIPGARSQDLETAHWIALFRCVN